MADRIKLVRNDTRPSLLLTLTDEETGAAIDITSATCKMYFRRVGETTILDTLTGVVNDGPNGIVTFPWNATTLDVPPGSYEGEVEITFQDLTVQTMYNLLKFTVREDFD